MNRIIISALSLISSSVLGYNGYGIELSGSILDENSKPCINHTVLLYKQETAEEIERLMTHAPYDSKQPYSHGEFNTTTKALSFELEGNKAGWSCRSDDLGHFAFSNLASGKYILNVFPHSSEQNDSSGEYEYVATNIELSSENISELIITPVHIEYFEVLGNLTSIKTGRPIAADVCVIPSDLASVPGLSAKNSPELMKSVKTDGNGHFLKHNVPIGNFFLDLSNINEASIRSNVSFQISINGNGEISVPEPYKMYLFENSVDIKLWTTKLTSGQNNFHGEMSTAHGNALAAHDLQVISGAGIITRIGMDPANPSNGRALIQMLEGIDQEKELSRFDVAIDLDTAAPIFKSTNRQGEGCPVNLTLNEWPIVIGKPYHFSISRRDNEYVLASVGFVAQENAEQVRKAYLASGWLKGDEQTSTVLCKDIQTVAQEFLKFGEYFGSSKISTDKYSELIGPLREKNRRLYSIYEQLHSHLKQIPPHATIFRGISPPSATLGISGTVLDISGAPAQGKMVALLDNRINLDSTADIYPLLCVSDQIGCFVFTNLTEGTYDLFVLQPPLVDSKTPVYETSVFALSSQSVSHVEIKPVIAPRLYVQGEVLSAATGEPVPSKMELFPIPSSKTISEIFLNPELLKPIHSNEKGLLSMPNLSTGEYLCAIFTDSPQASATFVITVTENDSIVLETKWKVLLAKRGLPTRLWTMDWIPN